MTYFVRHEEGGGNGIEPLGTARDDFPTLRMRSVTLDDWLETNPVQMPIAFMKIDVEGHERAVLEGARKTIEKHRPALVLESWEEWRERDGIPSARLRKELLEYLESIRYVARPVNGHSEMFLATPL